MPRKMTNTSAGCRILSRAFSRAATRLRNHDSTFICFALEADDNLTVKETDAAQAIVMDRMAPFFIYRYWVEHNYPEQYCYALSEGPGMSTVHIKERDGRVRWCKALASEFLRKAKALEKKGK